MVRVSHIICHGRPCANVDRERLHREVCLEAVKASRTVAFPVVSGSRFFLRGARVMRTSSSSPAGNVRVNCTASPNRVPVLPAGIVVPRPPDPGPSMEGGLEAAPPQVITFSGQVKSIDQDIQCSLRLIQSSPLSVNIFQPVHLPTWPAPLRRCLGCTLTEACSSKYELMS